MTTTHGGCLKTADCYDIPPSASWRTWNRRNNCKNNGSMSSSSFVASRRWNVVFVAEDFLRQPRWMSSYGLCILKSLIQIAPSRFKKLRSKFIKPSVKIR